ncbi:hypothetical protein PO124_21560 [Bacillus licheniformis]|nr:hypothetical protein [Bacillus licheniformis]
MPPEESKAKTTRKPSSIVSKATGLKASYAPYGAGQAIVKIYSAEIADESKAKACLSSLKRNGP